MYILYISTRGKLGVKGLSRSTLALLRQGRQEGPKAGGKKQISTGPLVAGGSQAEEKEGPVEEEGFHFRLREDLSKSPEKTELRSIEYHLGGTKTSCQRLVRHQYGRIWT